MNIHKFVSIIKVRPGVCFGKNKIDSISDIGFFINGFLCAETSFNQKDDFDMFFKNEFPKFVRKKLDVEPTEFEFWFETIEKNVNDNDVAIKLFFKLFDDFYASYTKNYPPLIISD